MSTTTSSPSGDLWGHPKGLYICFATELWERFSFYGMKYLLLLYLTKYHLFSDAAGLGVLGSYASLVYAMPVLGGLVADRFIGMRKAVTFGGALLVLGHLGMAVEGERLGKPPMALSEMMGRYRFFICRSPSLWWALAFSNPTSPRLSASFTQRAMPDETPASPSFIWASILARLRRRSCAGGSVRCMAGAGALAPPASAC